MAIKRMKVTDEDGNAFTVESEQVDEAPAPVDDPAKTEHPTLTDDEITALKDLAGVAPELKKLLAGQSQTDEEPDGDEGTGKPAENSGHHEPDGDETEDDDEEVEANKDCNDCDKSGIHDSIASSVGKNERRIHDAAPKSDIDRETAIDEAWAKRYGSK